MGEWYVARIQPSSGFFDGWGRDFPDSVIRGDDPR